MWPCNPCVDVGLMNVSLLDLISDLPTEERFLSSLPVSMKQTDLLPKSLCTAVGRCTFPLSFLPKQHFPKSRSSVQNMLSIRGFCFIPKASSYVQIYDSADSLPPKPSIEYHQAWLYCQIISLASQTLIRIHLPRSIVSPIKLSQRSRETYKSK